VHGLLFKLETDRLVTVLIQQGLCGVVLTLTWNSVPMMSIFPMTTSTGSFASIRPGEVSSSSSVMAPWLLRAVRELSMASRVGGSMNGNLKDDGRDGKG